MGFFSKITHLGRVKVFSISVFRCPSQMIPQVGQRGNRRKRKLWAFLKIPRLGCVTEYSESVFRRASQIFPQVVQYH